MTSTVLIVTMGVDYVAPARMSYELRQAGFRVGVLAPSGALALRTGHVDFRGSFADGVSLHEWTRTIAEAARKTNPSLILCGDDLTLRTLLQLALDPPRELGPILDDGLGDLIRASLGDASRCIDAIDKTRLYEHAVGAGIAVADGGVAMHSNDALAIAARVGFPVIVRRDFGSGGAGAARCRDAAELRSVVSSKAPATAWRPAGPPRHVVQRFVDGPIVTRPSLAWHGHEIAGFTRSRLATHPGPFGPGSVVEFVGMPAVADATRALCSGLAIHGYAGTQFLIDPQSGQPLLMEINRRMLPATHSGSRIGIDLAAALASAMSGTPWTGLRDLPEGAGPRLALFPQEWYRDPASHWLRELPCDIPWYDPALLLAMTNAARLAV
jgi:Carbamoyl-phosphate synthase L chain, ATP binding domain